MDKTYVTPFDWDFVDDNTLVYDSNSSKSDEEIKQMINEALSEALEDTLDTAVDGAVDEAISNMDIKLEGENLLYKLVVNGSENGEINIPKDQFLKSVSYDSENKKLVFVMETAEGDAETEVSVSDLVASIEDGVGEIQGKLTQIDEKDSAQDAAIADKADASALENLATKAEVQAVDAKVDALEIPSVEGLAKSDDVTAEIAAAVENKADKSELEPLAVKTEVTEEINSAVDGLNAAIADKADKTELETLATKAEVEAVDAKVEALEIPSVEGLAKAEDVTAEIAAAVEPLAVKAEVTEEINTVSSALADFETQIDTAMQTKADASALETLATKAEVQTVDAKVDALEIPSVEGLAKSVDVTAEIAAAVEPLATKEELSNKVDWSESTNGRKHIVLKNHDSLLGTATDGTTYNVAMVSKWDVADFGSAQLHLNLNTKDGVATINDNKNIATEDYVSAAIDGLAKSDDVTAAIATAIAPLATKSEIADKANVSQIPTRTSELVNDSNFITSHQSLEEYAKKSFVSEEIAEIVGGAPETLDTLNEIAVALQDNATMEMVSEAISTKANADDVYAKNEVYNKEESKKMFQASGDYVPVEVYNDLKARVDNLEIMLSIYNAEREAQMDEIIANMSADNKEVVIDTLMESIVVPETTTAYKITAPLTDNSTVELTSNKYAYIINTSEKPVSTSISHEYNEETSATTVYLSGQFDTLTLENITIGSSSSIEPATVNAVEIPQTNHQNITLALNFNDGATITNNSEYAVTINNKGEGEGALTIVAPFSTVTLNNGSYTDLDAEVSDDTLVIKKIAHIKNLNVRKGNVRVEVGKESAIADIIERYTIADGYSLDYIHGEITSANVSKLTSEGTWTLAEDINKSGRFAPGIFASDNIVWNLNGHDMTFTNTQGYANFLLRGSLQLEINGEGTITNNAGDYGFWAAAEGVKVVINGGTYYAATHVLYAEKGTIEVNGGEFHLTDGDTADKDANGNFKFLLNCKDENYRSGIANIIVKGGKFYDFDPDNCAAEGAGTSFLPETGYVSIESTEMIDGVEHKVFEVKPINE